MLKLKTYTIKELDEVFMLETISENQLKLFHTKEPIKTLREDGPLNGPENALKEDVYIFNDYN